MLLCLITKEGESLSFRIEKTRALELRTSIVGWSGTCDRSQARQKTLMLDGRQSRVKRRSMCTVWYTEFVFFAREAWLAG